MEVRKDFQLAYKKSTASIILNDERLKGLLLRPGTRQGCCNSHLPSTLGATDSKIKLEKENKITGSPHSAWFQHT